MMRWLAPEIAARRRAAGTQGRCGYGPRLPLLVISPYAKQNYVDHRATDQSSILRFIEDNWSLGRIGGDSSDVKAGRLNGMFDFDDNNRAPRLILNIANGTVQGHSERKKRNRRNKSLVHQVRELSASFDAGKAPGTSLPEPFHFLWR